jgi:hypothetical protein
MDAKSTHRPSPSERRIQFAERFTIADRYLAFHPNALRALRQPVPTNHFRPLQSSSGLIIELEQEANSMRLEVDGTRQQKKSRSPDSIWAYRGSSKNSHFSVVLTTKDVAK